MAGMNPLLAALSPAGVAGAVPAPPFGDPAGDPYAAEGAAPADAEMMAAALMGAGGPSPEMPPMMPPQGNGPMYPTTDPGFVGGMLEQLVGAQQADHEQLAAAQQSALVSNPLFEALMGGAPVGPGAGQDAAALEMDPSVIGGYA